MQKKRNIKSKVIETAFVFFCMAGAVFSIWMFRRELNQALYKFNETPIATITFKYKTAQRKFLDRMLWDRLRQNSPVYEGDTIRTAPQSEATVYFTDGNIMELFENTLARLSLQENSAAVEFDAGRIHVRTGSGGMQIRAGSAVLQLESGSAVSAAGLASPAADASGADPLAGETAGTPAASQFQIQVQSGAASLEAGGEAYTLEAGTASLLGAAGSEPEPLALAVRSPAPESKFLNHSSGKLPVRFEWSLSGDAAAENDTAVTLEVSPNRNFSTVTESYTFTDVLRADIELPSGISYWRMTTGENTGNAVSASGRVNVLHAPVPVPVAPADSYIARFRTKKPSVRFIWTESEWATSYELEIADNPQMNNPVLTKRSPQTSGIISSLDEGTYWWRVTPYYTVNNTGFTDPSEVYSFSIEKSGELLPPELLLPASDGIVHTKISKLTAPGAASSGSDSAAGVSGSGPDSSGSAASGGTAASASGTASAATAESVAALGTPRMVHFSWKDNPEAVSYTLKIGTDFRLLESPITATVLENYYVLNPERTPLANGRWFWQVTVTDVEGNTSESPVRQFLAIDADIEQRTLFPPDGYRLADSRTQDTRFVWKTNMPFATVFQLAADEGFEECLISQTVSATSMNGRALVPGVYYWRISAEAGGMNLNTPAKKLIVEAPLGKPDCILPEIGGRAIVRPATPFDFSWQPVEGADYYQLKIYASDDAEHPVYEKNFIEDTMLPVDMDALPEQTYIWSVQAFREETPSSSRAAGYLGRYDFSMRKLRPIDLVSPANNTVMDGVAAIKTPGEIRWSSVDEPASSQLRVYKADGANETVVLRADNPPRTVKLPRLYSGQYYWTVTGRTHDDLDISALEVRRFSVGAVPKLPAPVLESPEQNRVFDVSYFRNNRGILFTWKSDAAADEYIFRIYKIEQTGRGRRAVETETMLIERTLPRGEEQFSLEELSLLTRGSFRWSVVQQSLFEGALFQESEIASAEFEIDLPALKTPVIHNQGTLYGK